MVDQGGSRGTVQLRIRCRNRAARRSTRSCFVRSADTPFGKGRSSIGDLVQFGPGGRIRRYPGTYPQIIAVLEGSGEASGGEGVDAPIGAGEAVFQGGPRGEVRGQANGAHHRGRASGSVSGASEGRSLRRHAARYSRHWRTGARPTMRAAGRGHRAARHSPRAAPSSGPPTARAFPSAVPSPRSTNARIAGRTRSRGGRARARASGFRLAGTAGHSMTVLAMAGGSRPARSQPAAVAVSGTPTTMRTRYRIGTSLR